MANRFPIVQGEYFHVFNRGVDKRLIFSDPSDSCRFLESMVMFNCVEPTRGIYELSLTEERRFCTAHESEKLVKIVAYCLNPNHYHLILTSLVDRGISEFMKRLGGGYTLYFNEKYSRSGSLFQGKYKYVHIEDNVQLLHTSAYVNLNDRGHQIIGKEKRLILSSWKEYCGLVKKEICSKEIITDQFSSKKGYAAFAESSLEDIIKRKNDRKTLYHEFF
ncbi:MAG: transposase [bacterium]|nr:transposase [bacterium]